MLGGCADDLGSVAGHQGIEAPSIVRLSDGFAVAARRVEHGVELVAFINTAAAGWSTDVIGSGSGGGGGEMATHLVSMGGETGQEWNSFFFGTASGVASRVVVDGIDATGGQVADGAWVLAFRDRDLVPGQLAWRALDAIGGVIDSGTGITP
ncbi:MAG: hypothetical protein ACRDGB_12515 [Candidatus Limnocylindria bacterium]